MFAPCRPVTFFQTNLMHAKALTRLLSTTLFCCLIGAAAPLSAQVSARFSASPVSGCAPLVVHFADQSTGNPTQWRWDLGNGVASTQQNPSTSYFNPGTYTVKLVAKNASGADSIIKTSFITVFASPVVAFSASDTTGCFPLPVQFTDASTAVGGAFTSWSWDFGDGVLSSLSNPAHTYTAAGNFTVSLKVTTANGCPKTLGKAQYIKATDGVSAGFSQSATFRCGAPLTVQFTDTSKGPGPLAYEWNFGDGSTSVSANPAHAFTQPGVYTVRLVVVSPQGCRDTVTKPQLVTVGSTTSFTAPAQACAGSELTFVNTSMPVPTSVVWTFGDGTTSTVQNPVKSFPTPGTYEVKLVNRFEGCSDSVTKTIVILPGTGAAFTAPGTQACTVPFAVTFTATNAGGSGYNWDFGDGTTGTGPVVTHTYTSPGEFTVALAALNAGGCADTVSKRDFIRIARPVVFLDSLPQAGCVPLTVRPGFRMGSLDPIASYLWTFGDGTTSTEAHPAHVYTTPGTYSISLTVTTPNGCTKTVVRDSAVRVGTKPHADFTAEPADVCSSTPVHFTDNSTPACDSWQWTFGDTYFSNEQHPVHVFAGTGFYNVTLVVSNNGCSDTLKKLDVVHVRPPIANWEMLSTCAAKLQKEFRDASIKALTWEWSFGDGATSTEKNVIHDYAVPGTYLVNLRVTNGACSDHISDSIHVVDEKANFTVDKNIVCKGETVHVASVGISDRHIIEWEWSFGDGARSSNPGNASHSYAKAGTYTVTLRIMDRFRCEDFQTKTVTVYGPTANFSISDTAACLDGNRITFRDSSLSDGVNNIMQWTWSYGDGTVDSVSAAPFVHSYTGAGLYSIALRVKDAYGCADSLLAPDALIISDPTAAFSSPDTVSCTDRAIRFLNASDGAPLKYLWEFGDGTQGVDEAPVHHYAAIGSFAVTLNVTDRYGCHDEKVEPHYINISYPTARFTVSDSVGNCPPLLVAFTNRSTNFTGLSWDFGDGNTSTLASPSHYYTVPGIYHATLFVTGPGGCVDSIKQRIEVKGPIGTFQYDSRAACLPAAVTLTATTANRTSIVWDFGDGILHSGIDSVVTHQYVDAGEFVPKMILSDAAGCSYPVMGPDTIRVIGIDAVFQSDKSRLCDSGLVSFTNAMVSNDPITSWQWAFGDGGTSTDLNPTHAFNAPGVFPVTLTVQTLSGCSTASALQPVHVFTSPVVAIAADSSACMPALVPVAGTVIRGVAEDLSWNWNLGNGQVSTEQNPGTQSYTQPGQYPVSVVVTDRDGCRQEVSKNIAVHVLPVTNAGADALLCRDKTVQLSATGATRYVWKPSASLSCLTCAAPIAAPADTAQFIVTGYNDFGCTSTDTVMVSVRQPFRLLAVGADTICAGGTVQLRASGAELYRWEPATGLDRPNAGNPRANPSITTNYSVIATDRDGCFTDTARVTVKVYPIPVVTAGADVNLTAGGNTVLNPTVSADVTSWKWIPATGLTCATCPRPSAAPKATTTYKLQVRNEGGCASADDVTVSVLCNNGNLFIPNTFSPNADGSNDRFFPRGTGIHNIRSLRIYNRWGEVVFEKMNFNANDPAAGWDGTFKGMQASSDVYIYTCEVVCSNNEVLPFKGDVTLLR
jgi:gliding motility-associated-like protein